MLDEIVLLEEGKKSLGLDLVTIETGHDQRIGSLCASLPFLLLRAFHCPMLGIRLHHINLEF